MYYKILFPQIKHRLGRFMGSALILLMGTAFFCLSANLYLNSKSNIIFADDAFSTVAYFEFYQAVTKDGTHTTITENDYVGTFSVVVDDFDLNELLALPGVEYTDLRPILGGYIPGAVSRYKLEGNVVREGWSVFPQALIRFEIQSDEPLRVGSKENFEIRVLEKLGGALNFSNEPLNLSIGYINTLSSKQIDQRTQFNQGEDLGNYYLLEPGVEYLTTIFYELPYYDTLEAESLISRYDLYGADIYTRYGQVSVVHNGVLSTLKPIHPRHQDRASPDQPFWLWRWEDVQNDPEIKAYFEEVARAYEYSACSYAVMPTRDLNGIPSFYQKKLYVKEGRDFSEEDYASGNRVCVIGSELANIQKWQVGDIIDLSLYQYNGYFEGGNDGFSYEGHFPIYTKDNGGFFDRGEYTIVGIWDEYPVQTSSSLDEYTNNLEYNTIIIPMSSVQNLDKVAAPASGSRLTVHLENGMMEEFLEAASKVTLSESADEVRITAFDQGYSQAQDSLQSMLGTAQFLLILSSALLVVAGVLLAFFYAQSQKQNMALMRLLGCNRRQAGTMSLLGSLLILLPGGLLGMGAGHLLTDRVASAILKGTSALDKPEYAGFREVFGVQAEVDFALAAQPAVSAAALAIAAGLFLAGCLFFTLLLLRKEPREALQDK